MKSKLAEKYGHKNQISSPSTNNPSVSSLNFDPSNAHSNPNGKETHSVSNTTGTVSLTSSNGISANGSLAAAYTGRPKWLDMRLNDDLINHASTYSSSKLLFRPVSDAFPVTNIVASKYPEFPLGFSVQPFADEGEVPVISYGSNTIPRCESCRAYMNPYTKFLNEGYKFRCNICKFVDNVPNYYFSSCNESGTREDYEQRPELFSGSYEFKAGNE